MVSDKQYTKQLKALGAKSSTPAAPDNSILECFANPAPGRNYSVKFSCAEFTSVCPVTGQPDFGRLELEYAPRDSCLESKSFKLYLGSYRNEGAFWEDTMNRIADDLFSLLQPHWLCLSGVMNARGGIAITVTTRRGNDPG